jgi:competence protein ComEA
LTSILLGWILPELPALPFISPTPCSFFRQLHASPLLRVCSLLVLAPLLNAEVAAPVLPDGPGKQTTINVCGTCHGVERVAALHQSRRDWENTISKMVSMGANASDDELTAVLDYLSKNFPPAPLRPVDINTATAVELESSLLLLKSEAAAVIRYRSENGNFKSLDDLRNVPGLDFHKIEPKKDRIVF